MADTEARQPRSELDQPGQATTSPSKPTLASLLTTDDQDRPGKRPRLHTPVPMTAAAAIADARQRSKSPLVLAPTNQISPNPQEAVKSLLSSPQNAVTKAAVPGADKSSAEPTSAMSDGLSVAIQHMQPTTEANVTSGDSNAHTSPVSMSSYGNDSVAALARPETLMTSPQPSDGLNKSNTHAMSGESVSPDDGSRAFSYSSAMLQAQHTDGRRGMSLPHSGIRPGTRSPSIKKHKCPYCATEFTRHHNLKSHLLTHSQEKPYVCSTCQSRFRRLHDLKRHTKLHTGERPHVCPKCKRKFARGDALARHNKGPGGCAGRRASMGSFGGDDDYEGGEDGMEGVVYDEPGSMDDGDDNVSKGTPSIRRQAPSGDDIGDDSDHYASRIPSTYPPIQGRPPGGIGSGTFPPRPPTYGHPGPPASGPPAPQYSAPTSSANLRPGTGQIFAQNPMTESPKPLSPGQSHRGSVGEARIQSPNASYHGASGRYGRAMSGSGPGLHPVTSSAPQLPPPHALNPPDPRFSLPGQGAPTHPPTQPSGPPTMMSGGGPLSSQSNSLSSHGQSGHGSMENANSMINKDDRIWAYLKDLESKMTVMHEEIRDLRAQLAAATTARA